MGSEAGQLAALLKLKHLILYCVLSNICLRFFTDSFVFAVVWSANIVKIKSGIFWFKYGAHFVMILWISWTVVSVSLYSQELTFSLTSVASLQSSKQLKLDTEVVQCVCQNQIIDVMYTTCVGTGLDLAHILKTKDQMLNWLQEIISPWITAGVVNNTSEQGSCMVCVACPSRAQL